MYISQIYLGNCLAISEIPYKEMAQVSEMCTRLLIKHTEIHSHSIDVQQISHSDK